MRQRITIYILLLMFSIMGIGNMQAQSNRQKENETIFVWGGDINLKFVQYVADLTKKENPRICYLPTASGDHPDNIKYWDHICKSLQIENHILKVWVSSNEKEQSFEEILLNSDAIVVGGGNTLNMLGIWKAQGIDIILKKALKKGIILAGGSAGSICWFKDGISDSRPVHLSTVDGFGILPYSNCPHYSEIKRQNLYHEMILNKKMSSGYAFDDLAGVLFKNGKAVEYITQSDKHNAYFVSIKNGKIHSQKLKSQILVKKNALAEGTYSSIPVNRKVADYLETMDNSTPLNAFISEIKSSRLNKKDISDADEKKALNINVEKTFTYKNKITGVVNNAYIDSFGYGLWYFYNCNGVWKNMGEDIGGATLLECEITFREKAEIIIRQAEEKQLCK